MEHVEVWTKELADAPEGRAATATVLRAWTQHDSALLSTYIATGEERYDEPTLDASRVSSRSATLSASELHRLTRDVEQLIRDRIAAAHPVTTPISLIQDSYARAEILIRTLR